MAQLVGRRFSMHYVIRPPHGENLKNPIINRNSIRSVSTNNITGVLLLLWWCLLPLFSPLCRKFSQRLAVTRTKRAHALVGGARAQHFVLVLSSERRGREKSERGVSCGFQRHAARARGGTLRLKRVYLCKTFLTGLHRGGGEEVTRERGRNNQNATRIRWDPTPERERSGRSWSEGCRRRIRRRVGRFSLGSTRFNQYRGIMRHFWIILTLGLTAVLSGERVSFF